MVHPLIKQEIEKQLDQLPLALQKRVLDFALSLSQSAPKGVPGAQLLQFSGAISQEDLAQMSQAIEEGCEQVNPHDW